MVYYKVRSLTSKLSKRHAMKDATLNIEYRESFKQKKYELTPNGVLYISSPSLPVNLHKLRMQKMVTIVELSKNTFMRLQQPRVPIAPVVETTTTTDAPKKTRGKKTVEKD